MFRYYNSWTLAMLLDHSGSMLHAYPKVFFKTTEFTNAGACQPTGNPLCPSFASACIGDYHTRQLPSDLTDLQLASNTLNQLPLHLQLNAQYCKTFFVAM